MAPSPPPPSPPSPEVAARLREPEPETEVEEDPALAGCHVEEKAEYWGDLVKWGTDNLQPDAGACCDACKAYKPTKPGAINNAEVDLSTRFTREFTDGLL